MTERDKTSAIPRNGRRETDGLEEIVAHYLDLLNTGNELDPLEIAERYPDQSEVILQQLYAFLEDALAKTAALRALPRAALQRRRLR